MPKASVLVIDDAVVVRRMLCDVLASEPDIDVTGAASNGEVGLFSVRQRTPDVVILDVDMPVMDGLQTLAALQREFPEVQVIMFSALTERGASVTLDALARGAADYVTKPVTAESPAEAMRCVRDQLIPRVKALAAHAQALRRGPPAAPIPRDVAPLNPVDLNRRSPSTTRLDILAIGASTGGPNALEKIIAELPADLPVPVVIVQHMPPIFTRLLAERLAEKSRLPVREGADGALLEPGAIWIAPGGSHLTVARFGQAEHPQAVCLRIDQEAPVNSCRPSVDVLFCSVAEVYGARALAVVLTGMGQDGFVGCQRLSQLGAQIVAQDEATSVVWGMPGTVARAGLAQMTLPLDRLSAEILRRVRLYR